MEKKKDLINRHSLKTSLRASLIFIGLVFPQFGHTETLKSLAYRSTVILALSEDEALANKCHVTTGQISQLSQKLKAKVDKKISELSVGDYKIIKNRAKTCSTECICNVYSLAVSSTGETDVILERKAATESPQDRKRCVKGWKDFCDLIKF